MEVVHADPTYCVLGRRISDNIHLIQHVLDISGSLGVDTGLISSDQEKAFDQGEQHHLWKALMKEEGGTGAGTPGQQVCCHQTTICSLSAVRTPRPERTCGPWKTSLWKEEHEAITGPLERQLLREHVQGLTSPYPNHPFPSFIIRLVPLFSKLFSLSRRTEETSLRTFVYMSELCPGPAHICGQEEEGGQWSGLMWFCC